MLYTCIRSYFRVQKIILYSIGGTLERIYFELYIKCLDRPQLPCTKRQQPQQIYK